MLKFLSKLFHFHSWTKWEVMDEGPIIHRTHGQRIGWWMRQRRTCTECNLVQTLKDET